MTLTEFQNFLYEANLRLIIAGALLANAIGILLLLYKKEHSDQRSKK